MRGNIFEHMHGEAGKWRERSGRGGGGRGEGVGGEGGASAPGPRQAAPGRDYPAPLLLLGPADQ